MKLRATIEFEIAECDLDGADEAALERLGTMSADRVCDLVQIGFMNLLGATEANGELAIDNLMFEGEDHFLFISDPEVKSIAVVENFDVAVPPGAGELQ